MNLKVKYEYRHEVFFIDRIRKVIDCGPRFHMHMELLYVLSGSIHAVIDDQRCELQAGDMYVVFPDVVHSLEASDGEAILLLVDDAMFPAYRKIINSQKPQCPVLRSHEFPKLLRVMLERMLALKHSGEPNLQPLLTGYVNALVGELISCMELSQRVSNQALTHKLMQYLLEHYTANVNLEDTAKAIGYSKFHISRVISDTFGCNFRTLVNFYRVGMAKHLLIYSDKPIWIIANKCGFENQSSFNRVFLQQCGMTPSAYRQQDSADTDVPDIILR